MSDRRFLQLGASFTLAALISLYIHPRQFPLDADAFNRIALCIALMLVFIAAFELISRIWKAMMD